MVCIESCLPMAGALLFDEKIRQSAALFWFGLWDASPAFLEHGSAKNITVVAHANRDPNSYQIIKIKNKKNL
jgi:hypothetical protein